MNKELYRKLLLVVGAGCIIVALGGLYNIYQEYKLGQDIYQDAQDEYVQVLVPETQKPSTEQNNTQTEEPAVPLGPWYQRIAVDLAGLQSKYPEVVGWIYFENETISFPIMHTTDNNKYLRMAYDGTYSKSGSIYVETTHSGDFSDLHTLVYGHNQMDANMFGKLPKYVKYSWFYSSRKYFQIFSGDKIYRYQIFAAQDVKVDHFVFKEHFSSAKDLSNRLLENSKINPGLVIEDDDKIVTLCTCTDDAVDRVLISAVLIETYDRTNQTVTAN